MKVIVDMNLSPDWVPALAAGGIEAAHWSMLGDAAAIDNFIADWARSNDAIVLTRDLDFSEMLAIGRQSKPSVVQIRLDQAPPEKWSATVLGLLADHEEALGAGAVITLNESKIRVRNLPIT